jgi:hypothetical protein
MRNKEARNQYTLDRRRQFRARHLIREASIRARNKGIPFSVSEQEINKLQCAIDIGKCEISGYPLYLGTGKTRANNASLDRIIPDLGYVDGNLRIICYALNMGICNWGEDVLSEIVEMWMINKSGLAEKHSNE